MAFDRQALSEKGFTYEGFKGLRNNVSKDRFEMGDLEVANNVDLDDTGRILMRPGFTEIVNGPHHSLGPSGFSRLFVVGGTVLYEVLKDLTVRAMVTGLTPNLPVSYCVSGDRYYWTNGVNKGCIDLSGPRTWGIDVPPPFTGVASGGNLPVGNGEDLPTDRFQFCMTYVRKDGQESGAPWANVVDLPNAAGIYFPSLPVSTDPTVTLKRIYISEPNGKTMFMAMEIPNAQPFATYTSRVSLALPLKTQFLIPPPAANVVTIHGGRMMIAVGGMLYYGEPYMHELLDPRKAINFPSKIAILCSLNQGIHVGTEDGSVWLNDFEPTKFDWNNRAPYSSIPGTLDFVDLAKIGKSDKTDVGGVWASSEGILLGTPDGQVRNLTQDRFLYPVQERGAGLVRINRGINQYVVVMQGTETPPHSYA